MLRKLALSLAVSAALGASQVNALGLGEIQVNSALNEPLDAEIKLTQVRDLSPLQIQPRMASLDEYATADAGGQGRYLRDIQFQVLISPEGTGRIRLKSSEPVQEPFLNFMVEVNWPSGRLVREYTLLLDPPVFEPSPVAQNLTSTRVRSTLPAAQPATRRQAAPVENIRTRANTETQVYVGVNDTLWEIAKKVKHQGVTEHQMMLALLRKNPKAFMSGNINHLKAGSVMDIPTAEEARQLSHRESVAEVARQTQMWREGRSTAKTPTKAPLDVSKSATTEQAGKDAAEQDGAAVNAPAEGKLTVLAPPKEAEEARQVSSATSSVDSDVKENGTADASEEQVISAAAARLEDEVLMAQEKIDRLERDNADLNERLSSVLEELESQNRLLELQSQQMSTLQAELNQPQPAAAETPTKSGGNVAQLLENPTVLGGLGAGAIALLGGLWLLMRRKRAGEDDKSELVSVPEDLRDEELEGLPDDDQNSVGKEKETGAGAAAAAIAGGAAVAAAAAVVDDAQEEDASEFVRPPMESLAPSEEIEAADLEQDLQELDLDMDLDLDESTPLQDMEQEGETLQSVEFDLGVDEESLVEPGVEEEPQLSVAESNDLDELAFTLTETEADDEQAELDALLSSHDSDDDLDFLLADVASVESADDQPDELDPGVDLELDASDLPNHEPLDLAEDESGADNSLHETVETASDVEFEIDPALEAMLQGGEEQAGVAEDDGLEFSLGFEDDERASEGSVDDDLESLLASFDPDEDVETATSIGAVPSEAVEEELTANISHDLEMDLDAEVEELLSGTDDDIELEEQRNDEQDEILDKLNLLSDADEIETKLDLARAYIEMEDGEGARDILNEITSEGSDTQRVEAQKLLETLA